MCAACSVDTWMLLRHASMKHSITWLPSGLLLILGCSASTSSGGVSSDGGAPGSIAATPSATVTCTEVCSNVGKCGVAQARCDAVCPKLSLACQGCLAKATCQDACVAESCGSIASNPKKPPQSAPAATCDAITFNFSSIKHDGALASGAGTACNVPWDCSSQACISGQIGGKNVSFCAAETDCRENDPQLSNICPVGWKCGVVADSRSATATTRRTCVPPDAKPCAPGQLVY
jgi:hypothetical protein